jgi:hypothetical protein
VLLAADPLSFTAPDAGRPRELRGVAYAGGPLAVWGETIVLDLASMRLPEPCPLLEGHDRARRVGVVSLSASATALTAAGRLLDNPLAASIAADADQGFPWQMSVHAEAGATRTVAAGQMVQVNGRDLSGPLTVWQDVHIRELSLTPTGVDAETSAAILSAVPVARHAPTLTEAMTMPDPEMPTAPAAALAAAPDLAAQLAAMTARAEAAEAQLAAVPPLAVVGALQQQVAELAARLAARERDDLILTAEADGRLLPGSALHAHAASLDLPALTALLGSLTPIAALIGTQTGGRAPTGDDDGWTAALAAEFGDRATWEAWRAAEQAGRVRLMKTLNQHEG